MVGQVYEDENGQPVVINEDGTVTPVSLQHVQSHEGAESAVEGQTEQVDASGMMETASQEATTTAASSQATTITSTTTASTIMQQSQLEQKVREYIMHMCHIYQIISEK